MPSNFERFSPGQRFAAQLAVMALACGITLGLAALSGCTGAPAQDSPPKPAEVVEVKVPVSTPCVKQAPKRPIKVWAAGLYPSTDKAAAGLLLIDRANWRQYSYDWEAATAGCVVKP